MLHRLYFPIPFSVDLTANSDDATPNVDVRRPQGAVIVPDRQVVSESHEVDEYNGLALQEHASTLQHYNSSTYS
jgi:hypothetical protein